MKKFKFLLAALCMAALAVTSCENEDPNWNPTWAVPVLKETSLTVADFVDEDMAADFNAQVKGFWNDYVNEQIADLGIDGGAEAIDSLAYVVITNPDLGYVEMDEKGIPQLSDSIKDVLEDSQLTEDQINQIDDFLKDYFATGKIPNIPNFPRSASVKAAVQPRATPGLGSGMIDNLLDGISKNPVNIFPTVGTLLDIMPEYEVQINQELDNVIEQTKMSDTIDLDLKGMVQDSSSVKLIKVNMEMENTLPLKIKLEANFVDAKGRIIERLFSNEEIGQVSSKGLEIEFNEAALTNIVEKTAAVQLEVSLVKTENLTAETLKYLADKGVTFSLRVKAQAGMSNLF
ncbi:MAG: hypothetical protein LBU92_03820 [Prevotellaceae bacterium]|jgi:hypothetical protein|nr:hypothetical protein [Prevotellaceae bacterium]